MFKHKKALEAISALFDGKIFFNIHHCGRIAILKK